MTQYGGTPCVFCKNARGAGRFWAMFGEKNSIPEMAQRCPFSPFWAFHLRAAHPEAGHRAWTNARRASEPRFGKLRSHWGFGHPVSSPFPSFDRPRLRFTDRQMQTHALLWCDAFHAA